MKNVLIFLFLYIFKIIFHFINVYPFGSLRYPSQFPSIISNPNSLNALTILSQKLLCLMQGPALEGRNSPVFAKRFWKGNK